MKHNKIISIKKEGKSTPKEDKYHLKKILVNAITSIRSLGTIAIIPLFVKEGALATALASIGFFATDFIDGMLARHFHVQTFFGSLLDALSDKAFGIVCLLLLSTLNPIFLAIVGIEIGILTINYKSIQRGNNAQTSMVGKVKTFLLAGTIVGSFFCYSAPSLKEVLNYLNVSCFNTLLEVNPDILSTCLAVPTIATSLYVEKDYLKKAHSQDEEKRKEAKPAIPENNNGKESIVVNPAIEQKRQKLLQEKEAIKVLKSRQEIIHDLFDTEFYLTHKDDGIKQLLYKNKGSE